MSRKFTAAALMAVVSIAALYYTSRFASLWLIAALVLAPAVVPLRLPRNALLLWTIRFALLLFVLLTTDLSRPAMRFWYLRPHYTNMIGYALALEMVVQAWARRDRPPRGELIVLSGVMLAAASNTSEANWLWILSPVYAVLAVATSREFRPRGAPAGRLRWARRAIGGAAVLAMIGIGSAWVAGFQYYGNLLDRIRIPPLLTSEITTNVGLSSSPMLGGSANARPSTLRILRIEGLAGDAHLRGICFDELIQNRWYPVPQVRRVVDVPRAQLAGQASRRQWQVTRYLDDRGLLFVPLEAAGVAPMAGSAVRWDVESRMMQSSPRGVTEYTYEVRLGQDPMHQGPACGPLDEGLRKMLLKAPEGMDTRVRALAAEAGGDARGIELARRIEQWLQRNYQYSLDVKPRPGDRVSAFLLEKHPAHCQYFAAAAVVLLRCCGLPARYVTGYYAHESAGPTTVIVRQKDAHAWAECWIDGVGWITVDATPDSGRPDKAYPPTSWWRKSWEWTSSMTAAIADWLGGLSLANVLLFLAGIAGVIIAVLWVRVWLSRKAAEIAQSDGYACPADLAVIAARFETLLRKLGAACPATCTWRDHLAGVVGAAKLDAELAGRFVREYDMARFGRGRLRTATGLGAMLDQLERTCLCNSK